MPTGSAGGPPRGYSPPWGRVWGAGLVAARGGGTEVGVEGCSGGRSGSSGGGGEGAAARPVAAAVELQWRPRLELGAGFGRLAGPALRFLGRSCCGRAGT